MVSPTPAPVGNAEKVRTWLLNWLWSNTKHAKDQTATFHAALDAAELSFKGKQFAPPKDASKQQGSEIEFEEHKNQVNIVTAVMAKNVKRSGRTFRVQAINGEIQSRADATQAVMDAELEETGWEREIYRMLFRFNKFDSAGMKLICDFSEVVEPRRYEIAVDEVIPHMGEMDMQGKPYSVIGPADQTEPNGDFNKVLFETHEVKSKMRVGGKALEMRNIVVLDPKRPSMQQQPYIGESHIYTEDELEDNTMFRVNWDKMGAANANDKHSPTTETPAQATGTGGTSPNFKQWEVWESHSQIPWKRGLRKQDFNQYDLDAFIKEERGPESSSGDCDIPQNWIVYHVENKALLKIDPTYHPDKKAHVYYTCSYVEGDTELFGQSFMRQVQPLSNGMNMFANQALDNARTRGDISAFVDTACDLTPANFAEIRDGRNKMVAMEFPGGRTVKDCMAFVGEIIPNTFPDNMAGYTLCKQEARTFGAPDVIQGRAGSETATQDTMNNERGQEKIDYPFGRVIMDVAVPILQGVRELVFKHFDNPRIISIAGEEGATLNEPRVITRGQITNRFKIIPMANFDFNQQWRATMLLQAMNIVGRVAPPETLMKIFALFLEYNGEDRHRINELTDNVGRGTNAEQELRVMMYNYDERMQDRLRADDDPLERLMAIRRIMGDPASSIPGDPEKAQKLGANPNFQEYVQKCLDLLAMQESRMKGMAPPPPGQEQQQGAPQKGPAVQPNPEPPTDPESQVRSQAQYNSHPDSSGNTTGMTGKAVAA
jgi:hypothetical protein